MVNAQLSAQQVEHFMYGSDMSSYSKSADELMCMHSQQDLFNTAL
jgi:hypothetical protein